MFDILYGLLILFPFSRVLPFTGHVGSKPIRPSKNNN
jgi:hypothetical protein